MTARRLLRVVRCNPRLHACPIDDMGDNHLDDLQKPGGNGQACPGGYRSNTAANMVQSFNVVSMLLNLTYKGWKSCSLQDLRHSLYNIYNGIQGREEPARSISVRY